MFLLLALLVFVLVLQAKGRIGPFAWDPAGAPHPPRFGPSAPHSDSDAGFPGGPPWRHGRARPADPEDVLAARLADGSLDPQDYLERVSLLRER